MVTTKQYYKGGFQAVMTRDEAAKILGVRQTAPPEKITASHRKIMMLNHPDTGGSPYLATKINEAKNLLLGKDQKKSN
jgi:DnaJ family protein C protein 19